MLAKDQIEVKIKAEGSVTVVCGECFKKVIVPENCPAAKSGKTSGCGKCKSGFGDCKHRGRQATKSLRQNILIKFNFGERVPTYVKVWYFDRSVLTQAITESGYSFRKLSILTHLSDVTIGRILQSDSNPTINTLLILCASLDLSPCSLFASSNLQVHSE